MNAIVWIGFAIKVLSLLTDIQEDEKTKEVLAKIRSELQDLLPVKKLRDRLRK